MIPTKVVVIGAGSFSFGLKTLGPFMSSELLRGSELALVDRDTDRLGMVARLAERLNCEWDAQMTVTAHPHHKEALDAAEFVVSAIEVPPREGLWRADYEIPLKHGVRQPYAENGGPGGFAHAARNIGPVMEIVGDMERACPDAWFINFTNPMVRICDAISRYSRIKVVGLCHQLRVGYAMVGVALAEHLGLEVPDGFVSTHAHPAIIPLMLQVADQAMGLLDIKAAGINHFTWMLDLRDKRTGENLYPLFRGCWRSLDPSFEPLTRRMYEVFGLFPVPGDEHLCEYLPWVSDPVTKPWERYDISLYDWGLREELRGRRRDEIEGMADGAISVDHLRYLDSEGAVEIIEAVAGTGNRYQEAVNLPNQGYVSNLPDEAIVEVPGLVSGAGIHGIGVGPLPEPIAELCRREITVSRLCVDGAVRGDRRAALQCLLLDPVVTDIDVGELVLDNYLDAYREHLPQLW